MDNQIKIVYTPGENKFNGVLFLLREPNAEKDSNGETLEKADLEKTIAGNREWYVNFVCNNEKRNHQQSRYYNRFCEMLTCIQKKDPLGAVYTNIKLSGGGATASKEYGTIKPQEKKDTIDSIIDQIHGIQYVFTCIDIFNSIQNSTSSRNNDGVKYKNRKMRRCVYRGITFYEILHPCFGSGIEIDDLLP